MSNLSSFLTVDLPPEYYRFTNAVRRIPEWIPKVSEIFLPALGLQVIGEMRKAIRQNRYKGDTERSITSVYSKTEMELHVGPTHQRGNHDAGVLLELGTRPIPNVPWLPIKRWAEFRGIPAWPVYKKIREKGVSPHPFMDRTLVSSMPKIKKTLRMIADQLAVKVIEHTNSEGAV